MPKTLKRFDKESQKWVAISSTDSVVRHYLEDGSTITDKNIKITSASYRQDETTDLSDALEEINTDINTLKGNVSWLAEHGGNGSGGTIIIISGSTADTTTCNFELMSPQLDSTNSAYISSTSLSVKFKITGGTTSDTFQYKYIFDGNDVNSYVTVKGEEEVTITISNIHSITENTTHSFRLEGLKSNGLSISSLNFSIIENTLSISIDRDKNEMSQGGSEVLISKSDESGLIYFIIKNGILNSTVTINSQYSDTRNSFYYTNVKTTDTFDICVWDLIGEDASVNEIYTISIYAQATLGTSINNTSDIITFNVRVTDPNELSIYFDGLPYYNDEDTGSTLNVENNNKLSFSFKVFTPVTVTNSTIYYSGKMISPIGEESFIIGDSFVDNSYASQRTGKSNTSISVQIPLSSYNVDDGWQVIIKVWTVDGKLSTTKTGVFNIIESSKEIFDRQFNTRSKRSEIKDTCLYVWSSDSVKTSSTWVSNVTNYMSCGTSSETGVTGYINMVGTNGTDSGFRIENEVSYLRLQNDAYAYAVMDAQISSVNEITFLTNNKISEGFDISITFEADEDANYKKNVFFWGENSSDGELLNGIKINLTTVSWYIHDSNNKGVTLSGNICPGKKNTVDFAYDGSNNVYIYINGIINASYEVGKFDSDYTFPINAYFGCDFYNGEANNFSDIKIYEFAVYTRKLTPLQIAVNGKNARLDGLISNETVLSDYAEWKTKNLIYVDDSDPYTAKSYLIDTNGDFSFDTTKYNEIAKTSLIPIIRINANGSSLTKELFEKNYSNEKNITATTFDCKLEYYDPETVKTLSFNALVSLQGTSTLGYLIKNLEIKVNETCTDDATKYKLFQPKKTWFPEREFTLKADIVDSAHANNATIGKWINENALKYGIMEKNPAMNAFTDNYRPKDRVIYNGETKVYTHNDTRTDSTTYGTAINYDENVSIKFNLEGFPIILFIQFDNSNIYELIGIYSFNLGRYSYYNMGMSFLKAFSRRDVTNQSVEVSCPALVDYYEEYSRDEVFNGITPKNIYTYEFGASADDNSNEHMTWSQDNKEILQFYGSFNFNGENPESKVSNSDSIWDKLSLLFSQTANMSIKTPFNAKKIYTMNSDKTALVLGTGEYVNSDNLYADFDNYLSITNAVGYFIVATAFGMVDSLGKNLTLRTWDGGTKWYTCFYDMDTALGLSNEGQESISSTAFLDIFSNKETENITTLNIDYHSENGGYNAYNSKLWEIFRDGSFLYGTRGTDAVPYYNDLWISLRSGDGPLSSQDKFVTIMEEQTTNCGELLYDYDYYTKYILDSQNISMLHGNRIEYVRNWLRKRFYFLDGALYDKSGSSNTYKDSPFYMNSFNVTNQGHSSSIGYIEYNIKTVSPTFIMISTGSDDRTDTESRYFIPEYTNTTIKTNEHTSTKQTIFTASSLYTNLEGLTGINVRNTNANNKTTDDIFPSLTNFDISGSKYLQNDPLNCAIFEDIDTEISNLETIDVSNTSFENETGIKFLLDLSNFTKIKNINISNSCVTSLSLPNSVLNNLSVRYSSIDNFIMSNQIGLSSIDFTGCNKLQKITISNSSLVSLNISDIPVLNSINITNCSSLTSFTISNIDALTSIQLNNNSSLKEFNITNCKNSSLTIKIVGSKLETIKVEEYNGSNITLPNKEDNVNLTSLTITKSDYFESFNFNDYVPSYITGDTEEDTYGVLDLRYFTNINYDNVNIESKAVKYIRVNNNKDNPVYLKPKFFEKITNVVRVFGCLGINDEVKYNTLSKFYLNYDSENYNEIVDNIIFNESEEYTNIVLSDSITSLASCFSDTSIDENDMYYILSLENINKVNNMANLFSNCSKVIIDNIDVNLFKNCTNVYTIEGLFNGCTITGKLPNHLLDPITCNSQIESVRYKSRNIDTYVIKDNYTGDADKILETYKGIYNFSNVFTLSSITISENGDFFNSTSIETITNFNPQVFDDGEGDGYAYFTSNTMLNGLSQLKYLNKSFNGCGIDFSNRGLLDKVTSIVSIINSFSSITVTEDYQIISSKEQPLFKNCTNLKTIDSSFMFKDITHFNDAYQAYMEITDNFFEDCKNSLESITDYASSRTNDYEPENETNLGCFTNVKKFYNQSVGFPTGIFSGCVNLKEIPGFLNGLICIDGDIDDESGNLGFDSVKLPGNMLNDCSSLENFSYGFSNFSGITFELSPNGFSNCVNIKNIACIFSQSSTSSAPNCYKYGLKGMIPYHMFYNPNNTIENMSNCFADCKNSAITTYQVSDDEINTYGIENGVWNTYIYDGSSDFYDRLTGTTIYGENTGLEIPEIFKEYVDRNVISVVEDITGFEDYNNSWFKDCFQKTNYFCPPDIFKYCVSNATIDYAFSNSSKIDTRNNILGGFRGRIPNILFKPLSDTKTLTRVFNNFDILIPDKWGTINLGYGNMYPEDLFEGSSIYGLNGMFAGTRIWGNTLVSKTLLDNISENLTNISSLWSNSKFIKVDEDIYQIPVDMFDNCTNLANISNIFSSTNVHISDEHFSKCVRLTNVNGFMSGAIDAYGTAPSLWDTSKYPSIVYHVKAFYGATNIDNYNNIYENYPEWVGDDD